VSLAVLVAILTMVLFEPAMALVHRWLFHGPLWCLHRSHHEQPRARRLVPNDALWVTYFVAFGALIAFGAQSVAPWAGAAVGFGAGACAYGIAYLAAHDGLAHGRFWMPAVLRRSRAVRRLVRAHHHHHRDGTAGMGAPPFGVYAAHLELEWGLSEDYEPRYRSC
jgi:beta-carotene 3-hydroxylase